MSHCVFDIITDLPSFRNHRIALSFTFLTANSSPFFTFQFPSSKLKFWTRYDFLKINTSRTVFCNNPINKLRSSVEVVESDCSFNTTDMMSLTCLGMSSTSVSSFADKSNSCTWVVFVLKELMHPAVLL